MLILWEQICQHIKLSKNQFAYGPVTSRNGDKISLFILEEKALLSQAYVVLKPMNTNVTRIFNDGFADLNLIDMHVTNVSEVPEKSFDWQENERAPIPSLEKSNRKW